MKVNWKLPAVSGGIAFLISVLAGLLGGVGFGTILLRAFIGGVLFGALAIGVEFILRRIMPEMFLPGTAATSAQSGSVDITSDEDITKAGSDGASEDCTGSGVEFETTADSDEVAENLSENAEIHVDDSESAGEESTFSPGKLPSFDSLESTFAESDSEGEVEDSPSPRRGIDVLGAEEDPAIVAEAVRTLMKRDQEG